MRARSLCSTLLLVALCAGCSASGQHRKHNLRFHGGLHEPWDDVVRDLTTGDGTNKTWGIEYAYQPDRGVLGVEAGLFQSLSDGEGDSLLPGVSGGSAVADKMMDEIHVGMHYPFQRFWGLETDIGLGLAYIDTEISTTPDGDPEVTFQDEGFGAYARVSSMLPITDSVGIGLDLRYLAPFDRFEDTQQGLTFDTNLRQFQATLFLALSW